MPHEAGTPGNSIQDAGNVTAEGLEESVSQTTPKTGDNTENYEPAKFDTLVYPDDLNPDNFFPESICFTVKKRLGLDLKITLDSAAEYWGSLKELAEERKRIRAIGDVTGDANYDLKARIQAANEQWENKHPKLGKAPEEIGESVLRTGKAISVGHKKTGRTITPGKTQTEALGSIYMNMPNTIQYSEDSGWNPNELGMIGQMTKQIMGGGGSSPGKVAAGGVAGATGSIVGGMVGGMMGKVAGLMGLGGSSMIGAGIGAIAGGSGLQRGAEAALSVKQNPYMEMMFSGIGFRQFKFDFIMRPKDVQEVKTVGNILKMFREHSHPSFVGGGFGNSFMNYPQEFHIQFLTYDEGSAPHSETLQVNKHLPFLKPCVCTSVESNYTPQSVWTAYRGGASPAISLSLGFQETELVMASDVKKGF